MYILKQTTGHPARGDTSSRRHALCRSWEADRSRRSYGILSTGLSVSIENTSLLDLVGTYQILEDHVGHLSRIVNAQIFESLGRRVDDLVVERAFDLVAAHNRPPESLVDVMGGGLCNGLGDADGGAVLDNLTVHKLSNLAHGVVGRSVKLEGLANGALVVQHQLKGVSDLGSLKRWFSINRIEMPIDDLRGRARSAVSCGW